MQPKRSQDLPDLLRRNFPFQPTPDQARALQLLADYLEDKGPFQAFLLRGYAGTGKTTLVRSLVKSMAGIGRRTVLLAPTGRAAKVMGQYAGRPAFTLHKYLYQPRRQKGGGVQFVLRENKGRQMVFIVDEASMINDQEGDLGGNLLSDLLHFFAAGTSCKLILIGDVAQLPPVHAEASPALDPNWLEQVHRRPSQTAELSQVMRQEKGSQLLANATALRALQGENPHPQPVFRTGPDVVRLLEGFEVEEALNLSFAECGREGTAVIVRSNKRAGLYNRQIRQRILWQEDEISTGDYLMVVKNSYFWLPAESKASFIANGDIVELLQIYEIKFLYGYRFARVKIRLVDYPDEPPLEVQIFLDVLDRPSASLPWEESRQFYQTVLLDYADEPSRYKQHEAVRNNPYFNALQVKFAYAVTCHKAQGGQWDRVFVEKPWLPPEEGIGLDYLRWLYTAFTRAKDRVYLIGFDDAYFSH